MPEVMKVRPSGSAGLERGGPPVGDERRLAAWIAANCDTDATVEQIIEARSKRRAGTESRRATPSGDTTRERVRDRLNNNITPAATTTTDPATAMAARFLKGSR